MEKTVLISVSDKREAYIEQPITEPIKIINGEKNNKYYSQQQELRDAEQFVDWINNSD